MKKDKLIAKQALKLDKIKKMLKSNAAIIKKAKGHFIAIGQPLNDNKLAFTKEQLTWCNGVYELLQTLRIKP